MNHATRTAIASVTRNMQPLDWRGPESQIDQCVGSFRGKTMPPIGLTQPIAQLDGASVLMRLYPAATEEGAVVGFRNGIDALANRAGACASHEIGGIRHRIGVGHASDHVGDVGVVGEMGKGVDVVYDSVGKDTFPGSLDCLKLRGLWVSFGNSSGMISILASEP